jgi:hypothetical protein
MPINPISCSFNGVNLSAEDCATIIDKANAAQQGIFQQLINNPFLWISLIVCIIIVGIYLLRPKSKNDPSLRDEYGREVRERILNEELKDEVESLGTACKLHVRQGTSKLGFCDRIKYGYKILEKTELNVRTRQMEWKPGDNYRVDNLRYRKYGLLAWIMSLLGYGYRYITITNDAYKIFPEGKKDFFYIDPLAHLINDSKVWTLSSVAAYKSNESLLLNAINQNLMGTGIDNVRKQAVFSAQTASTMEKMSHEQNLKEKDRKSRESGFV